MKENLRLVQMNHPVNGRKIALVQEPYLVLLSHFTSIYQLALAAIESETGIATLISQSLSETEIDYDAVYEGRSEWTLLPSFDCPSNPFSCMVSGTGLTHKNSALNRQLMHAADRGSITDSMWMYQWGLEGGQPEKGNIGIQPEWFYKGTSEALKGHGQSLIVPPYADDGGEEPEVAGVYIIAKDGSPFRIGFTIGNEFSDHVMERKNYLYLAPSKLRNCAIGPELVIDMNFTDIRGTVEVLRNDEILWSASIKTGEKNMAHSLANLEHHHFKYTDHRLPMQSHVHFFGADAFSFGAGHMLVSGDKMQVHWEGMGRPLVNPIVVEEKKETPVVIQSISHFRVGDIA